MPRDVPETTPDTIPTLATPGALLVHNPPGVGLLNVVVVPMHKLGDPVMADGNGLTVTVAVV